MIGDNKERRKASHSGSWYNNNGKELQQEIKQYIDQSEDKIKEMKKLKAIIGPHAGFRFSGTTAGYCYKYLQKFANKKIRVFLLGPSHKLGFDCIALSKLKYYDSPIGNLEVDIETISSLERDLKENNVQYIFTNKSQEENEHSLEMHLPFLAYMSESGNIKMKLIPIMVGWTDSNYEETIGKVLANYFDQEDVLFVISSDFCHWGANFDYFPYDKQFGEVHHSIAQLDQTAMQIIMQHDSNAFYNYIHQTQNTICGRHPIQILLATIQKSQLSKQLKTQFVQYSQSNQAKSKKDSSVSYAASATYL